MWSSPERRFREKKLDFIYRLKTGALLEASMMIGAVLAGATVEEIKEVERWPPRSVSRSRFRTISSM